MRDGALTLSNSLKQTCVPRLPLTRHLQLPVGDPLVETHMWGVPRHRDPGLLHRADGDEQRLGAYEKMHCESETL